MPDRPLTVKQAAFCKWLFTPGSEIFGNGTESARRAGYSGTTNQLAVVAHGNRRKAKIIAERDRINACVDEAAGITDAHLTEMYLALQKRALTHDTGAAKLIAQRFDPKYTERSQQDIRGVFAGYEPTEAQNSRERQRKALVSQEAALPVVELPEPTQGAGHVYAGLARAMQAQTHIDTQHTEHEQSAGNEETLDFKPVTKVDPPGGGL